MHWCRDDSVFAVLLGLSPSTCRARAELVPTSHFGPQRGAGGVAVSHKVKT